MPHGPTAFFNLSNVVFRSDIENKKQMSEEYPHLLFHEFGTKLAQRVSTSDFPGYPRVLETLGYPGSKLANRVLNSIYILFFYLILFFILLKVFKNMHSSILIHLCVFMDTAISIDTLHCNTAVCNMTVAQYPRVPGLPVPTTQKKLSPNYFYSLNLPQVYKML